MKSHLISQVPVLITCLVTQVYLEFIHLILLEKEQKKKKTKISFMISYAPEIVHTPESLKPTKCCLIYFIYFIFIMFLIVVAVELCIAISVLNLTCSWCS